jgi:hypothetical protein
VIDQRCLIHIPDNLLNIYRGKAIGGETETI